MRTGAGELRRIVRAMDDTREDFLDRFTAEQLVTIYRAMFASEQDVCPDLWTEEQVQGALRGEVPNFENDEADTLVTRAPAE